MAGSVIAAQMYNLREFTKTRDGLVEAFQKVADIGYEAVQLSAIGVELSAEEMKALLDEAGLTVCCTHIPFERMREDIEGVIADHRILGCRYPGVSVPPEEYRNAQGYPRFAREISTAGQQLAEAGMKFAYHNHSFEMEKYGDRLGLEVIFEDSDPECVVSILDTYWIQHGGGNPIAWIRELRGRLPLLHLKDMTIRDGQQIMAEVGEGNLDWEGILDAAQEAGVEWYIVEQDTCERDPFESLAISFNNMKAMGLD